MDRGQRRRVGREAGAEKGIEDILAEAGRGRLLGGVGGQGEEPRVPAGRLVKERQILAGRGLLRGGEILDPPDRRLHVGREALVLGGQRLDARRHDQVEREVRRGVVDDAGEDDLVALGIDRPDFESRDGRSPGQRGSSSPASSTTPRRSSRSTWSCRRASSLWLPSTNASRPTCRRRSGGSRIFATAQEDPGPPGSWPSLTRRPAGTRGSSPWPPTPPRQATATGLGQDVLYALFRAGLPTDTPSLASIQPATVAAVPSPRPASPAS